MIILHGDNQVASRAQLTLAKQAAVKSGKQVIELEGDVTLDQVVTAVESNSLFGNTNTVVIENLFSGRPSNQRKAVADYLLKNISSDIVAWDGKDISTKIKEFDPLVVRRFDLPRTVFKFLDDLSLSSLELALQVTPAEQILALLAGHLHKLILVKESVANLPSWQIAKLNSQVTKFSLEKLKQMAHKLLEIDYAQKTSASPYELATGLELWVARL